MLNEKYLRRMMPQPMLTIPAELQKQIDEDDRKERQHFLNKLFWCAVPAVVFIAALVGYYGPDFF